MLSLLKNTIGQISKTTYHENIEFKKFKNIYIFFYFSFKSLLIIFPKELIQIKCLKLVWFFYFY